MRDIRMYILVNQDIEMSKGELAIQVCHAAEQMIYNQFRITGKMLPALIEYMGNSKRKTLLYCSQEQLENLEVKGYVSVRGKIDSKPIHNALTCVNVGLAYSKQDLIDELSFVIDLQEV